MRHLDLERKPAPQSVFRRAWRLHMFPDPSASPPRGSFGRSQRCFGQVADGRQPLSWLGPPKRCSEAPGLLVLRSVCPRDQLQLYPERS